MEAAVKLLLTLAQVMARYPVPLDTLRNLIRSGKLPASKVGRLYYVAAEDVDAIFQPKVRVTSAKEKKLTPNQREVEQLRKAGIR